MMNTTQIRNHREPWHEGKLVRQKAPLKLRVRDVSQGSQMLSRAMVEHQKTHQPVQFEITKLTSRLLKNVFEAADARQKQVKKRSLCLINEHFELVFNTAAAMQIVFQRPARDAVSDWINHARLKKRITYCRVESNYHHTYLRGNMRGLSTPG